MRLDAGNPGFLEDAQRFFVGKLDDGNLPDPPDEIRVVLEREIEFVGAACAHDAHGVGVAVHVGRQRLDLIAVKRMKVVDEHDDADLFPFLDRERRVEEALDRLFAACGIVGAGERHQSAWRDRDPVRALQHPPVGLRMRILSGDGPLHRASGDRRLGARRSDQHRRLALDAHERVENLVGFAVAADDRRRPALLRTRAFVVGQILADDRAEDAARAASPEPAFRASIVLSVASGSRPRRAAAF